MKSYFKEIKPYFLFSVILFVVASVLGYFIMSQNPNILEEAVGELEGFFSQLLGLGSVELFLVIFLNNSLKIFIAMISGVLLGLIPILFLFINGYVFGIVAYSIQQDVGLGVFIAGILPHGIIELPVAFAGAAIGLMLGVKTMLRIIKKREDISIKNELKMASSLFFKLLMPLLLIAALIEVFITPYFIGLFAQ